MWVANLATASFVSGTFDLAKIEMPEQMNRNRRSNNYYLLHFGGSIQANSFHFIAVHKASNNLIHPSKLIPSFSSNNFGFPQLCYTDGFYAAVCHQLGNDRKMISDIYPFTHLPSRSMDELALITPRETQLEIFSSSRQTWFDDTFPIFLLKQLSGRGLIAKRSTP